MFPFGKRTCVLIGVVAAIAAFAVPGTAMASTTSSSHIQHANRVDITRLDVSSGAIRAVPDTGSACNPDILEVVSECTVVTGTGLYVDSIGGQTFSNVVYTLDDLHIEIYGPKGHIANCPQFNLPGGGVSEPCVWVNPHGNSIKEPAGDYCSRVWQYDGDGHYSVLSAECIDVHS